MKKHVFSAILLLASCAASPPPVIPANSRDINPPADAKKSDVYWRSGKGGATTKPVDAPKQPSSKVPDWTNPNDFRTFSQDLTREVTNLPEGNPLKTLKQKTLANGLRVYAVYNKELPLFAATLYVPAGSSYDSTSSAGVAALTSDIINKGANGKDAQQIATIVESLGADLSVSSSIEITTLSTQGLARDAETLLGLMSDITAKPTFDKAEFVRAQELRINALQESFDDQAQLASGAMWGNFFKDHPYGLPSDGTLKSVEKITLEDVKKFHAGHYIPNNSFVVIVGDIESDKAIDLVEKSFSGWSRAADVSPTPTFVAYPTKKQVIIVDKKNATQVQVRIAWKGVANGYPDEDAIDLVNTTLGGGFTSHLVDELRVNNGYVYGVSSGMRGMSKAGVYSLRTATKLESVRPAIDLALKVIADYRKTNQTDIEFNGAKAYVAGQFPTNLETNAGLAGSLAEAIFAGQGPRRIFEYTDRIKGLSSDKAKSTIDTFIPTSDAPYVMILVGPAEKLRKAAEGLGEITVVTVGEHFGL